MHAAVSVEPPQPGLYPTGHRRTASFRKPSYDADSASLSQAADHGAGTAPELTTGRVHAVPRAVRVLVYAGSTELRRVCRCNELGHSGSNHLLVGNPDAAVPFLRGTLARSGPSLTASYVQGYKHVDLPDGISNYGSRSTAVFRMAQDNRVGSAAIHWRRY